MLPLASTPSEFRSLREALRTLHRADPQSFAALFDPMTQAALPPGPSVALLAPLRDAGFVEEREGALIGQHRIRHRQGRFYVMELGGSGEYHQDVWPETDALLSALEGADPGRLLDVGTGTGIVAIEAAARGHRVVATDLYPVTLQLARFNAALNGFSASIDFRQGHLFDPVVGERFDLILTAPHYTRVNDQLRLEALRCGPAHIAPGGRLVVATVLEWEGQDGPLAAVEALLRPLAERGAAVQVLPIDAQSKREWFAVAHADETILGLVSRSRFLVIIEPVGERLVVKRMPIAEQPAQHHVPLARLRLFAGAAGLSARPALAVVSSGRDLDRLRELLVALHKGMVTLSDAIPSGLLDACRFGPGVRI